MVNTIMKRKRGIKMEDNIELVIKIPKGIYVASQMLDVKPDDIVQIPLENIANGTSLPKGHGRLIDENETWDTIKVLEQEPVLDKVREEVEQITDIMGVSYNPYVNRLDVLQIIDKYKAEIIEVTKKEVTAKVESLTPEQIHAAAVKIEEERINIPHWEG